MAANFLWYPGASNSGLLATSFNLLTTEMNSLATAGLIVSSVGGTSGKFTNSDTAQSVWGDLYLKLGTIGTAIVAGGNLAGWFLMSPDSGTTYEAQSGTHAAIRPPDFIIPLPATTITATETFKSAGKVLLPALQFKVLVQNNSGQTFAASGNSLLLSPQALQY